MRLLLFNPNTNAGLTESLGHALSRRLDANDHLHTATAAAGAAFIDSEAAIAVARAEVATAVNDRAGSTDAVLLGCFGDLGLDGFRRAAAVPMVALSDVCFAIAPLLGRRLAIVTTSTFWAERIGADVRRRAPGDTIVAAPAIAAPEQMVRRCRDEIARLAAGGTVDAIVLGGGPLTVLRDELLATSALPILDLLGAAVGLCRALAAGRADQGRRSTATDCHSAPVSPQGAASPSMNCSRT